MVLKSTVPVGTGARVRQRLDERGLTNVGYVSNPEFTAEGTAVRDFQRPDRIVIGAFDEADGDAVAELHRGIEAPIVRCDVASAEMIKLAANAALMTRISFINEIANVCEATGADVVRVAEGIGLDRRIGPSFLRAGIGYGGCCFPKDSLALKQLAANSGYHFQLLNSVIEVNELQKRRVIGKLQQQLGTLRGTTVSLLGLAFKPETDDTREAPASFWPAGSSPREPMCARGIPLSTATACCAGDDLRGPARGARGGRRGRARDRVATVGGVDWRDAARRMRHAFLVDGRNMLDPAALRAAGFVYEAIGRAARALAPGMEALILAGGKAERLGDAARGNPKPLVPVAGGRSAGYMIRRLAAAGVDAGHRRLRGGARGPVRRRPRPGWVSRSWRPASRSRSGGVEGSASPPGTGARTAPCWR